MPPEVISSKFALTTEALLIIERCLVLLNSIDWTSFGTFIVALATFYTAWVTRSSARATQTQSETAEKTRLESFRPHLIVKEFVNISLFKPNVLSGGDGRWDLPFVVNAVIDNYGSQPAVDIDAFATIKQNNTCLTTSQNSLQKVSLLRSNDKITVRMNTIANEKSIELLTELSNPIYVLFENMPPNGELRSDRNITLKINLIYKNFTDEIFMVEVEYFLLPNKHQDLTTIKQMLNDLQSDPEIIVSTNYDEINLKAVLKHSSYKATRISVGQYKELTQSLNQQVSIWAIEETEERT